MAAIAIITHTSREGGDPGGVPKWAWYLKRALDGAGHEVRHITWADHSCPELERSLEHVQALALSSWVGERASDYDCIIADGFWGWGLPDTARAIICAHGTWAGFDVAVGGVPPEYITAQQETFRRFPVVAVSASVRNDLLAQHQVRAVAVIGNGVDLDLYRPDGHARGRLVRHANYGRGKGGDVVERIAAALNGSARVEYLAAAIGCEPPRFAAADCFLHPSRYDGDAYACLEALACGVPLVHSFAGRWAGEPDDARVGRGVEVGAPTAEWVAAIEALLADSDAGARAREYAEECADYRAFARAWVEVVTAK